jgi:hypothetical protein
MSIDIFPNRLIFLKYHVVLGIPHSPNNAKHKPPLPKQISQTYNDFPAENLVIDIEGHQGHMTLPSLDLSKLQFISIPDHRAIHKDVGDSFRMVHIKRATIILRAQDMSLNQEGSCAKTFI